MRNLKGWIKEDIDIRDKSLSPNYLNFANIIQSKVDLRDKFTPIEDQGQLGSCTSNALAGVVEYYQKNTFGTYTNLSRLFTYKTSRNLIKLKGDEGSTIRATMGALNIFGACPESYYNYKVKDFDKEPTSFQYALASRYKSIDYYRLDLDISRQELLERIKIHLSNNIPVIFGFYVFDNYNEAENTGIFPLPNDNMVGGHAVVIVGYDDEKQQVIIRNSWGTSWGDNGYGYLPFEYILNNYSDDFWVMIKSDWVNIKNFTK